MDVALVGARNLDPPEREFLATTGIDRDIDRALAGAERVYVALDLDVVRPGEVAAFMPEPGGPGVDEIEELLRHVVATLPLAGAGFSGLRADPANEAPLTRLAAALGL
jgi:arginase family enzyme